MSAFDDPINLGSQGPRGPQGLGVLSGTTAPASGLGRLGEFYMLLDGTTGAPSRMFGPKSETGWGLGYEIPGPVAEAARIAAEQARVAAELVRIQNEILRVQHAGQFDANETLRIAQEADRVAEDALRVARESARIAAETARAAAESARVAAETARVGTEQGRVNAEQARATAEIARATAETARATVESARDTAESARAVAESARATAETARATAETGRVGAEGGRVAAELLRAAAAKNLTVPLSCLGAAPLQNVSLWAPSMLNVGRSIRSDGTSGVLITTANNTPHWFDFLLPFGIVIGDSIAEGHPTLHGRLHAGPNFNDFVPSQVSQWGQISWELASTLGIPVVNQAIGSQTSQNVRDRWNRDVLGQITDPGDGRGNNTHRSDLVTSTAWGTKPLFVYLHIGVNDIATGVPLATLQANVLWMAQSCRDNGIFLILPNIGAFTAATAGNVTNVLTYNTWLNTTFKTAYPEVNVVDYLTWSNGGASSNPVTTLRGGGMYADGIHPSREGYRAWTAAMLNQVNLPIWLQALQFDGTHDGPTAFARITDFTLNGQIYRVSGAAPVFDLIPLPPINTDNPVQRMDIRGRQPQNPPQDAYQGFARASAILSSRPVSRPTPPEPIGGVVAAVAISTGVVNNAYRQLNFGSLDNAQVSVSGQLTVTFTVPVHYLDVQMIGSAGNQHQMVPLYSTGTIDNGTRTWTIQIKRASDGALGLSLSDHNYRVFGIRI